MIRTDAAPQIRRYVPFRILGCEDHNVYCIGAVMRCSKLVLTFYNQTLDQQSTTLSSLMKWVASHEVCYQASSRTLADGFASDRGDNVEPQVVCNLLNLLVGELVCGCCCPWRDETNLSSLRSAVEAELVRARDDFSPDRPPLRCAHELVAPAVTSAAAMAVGEQDGGRIGLLMERTLRYVFCGSVSVGTLAMASTASAPKYHRGTAMGTEIRAACKLGGNTVADPRAARDSPPLHGGQSATLISCIADDFAASISAEDCASLAAQFGFDDYRVVSLCPWHSLKGRYANVTIYYECGGDRTDIVHDFCDIATRSPASVSVLACPDDLHPTRRNCTQIGVLTKRMLMF